MTTLMKKLVLVGLTTTLLTACGGSSETDHSAMNHESTETSSMDDSKMGDMKMAGETGHSTGEIISISPNGKHVTIDHVAIDGVGMGAMTMSFSTLSAVDLSSFSATENVSFMVKKGRDGSYRITAMCNTDKEGPKCLDTTMDHSGH